MRLGANPHGGHWREPPEASAHGRIDVWLSQLGAEIASQRFRLLTGCVHHLDSNTTTCRTYSKAPSRLETG